MLSHANQLFVAVGCTAIGFAASHWSARASPLAAVPRPCPAPAPCPAPRPCPASQPCPAPAEIIRAPAPTAKASEIATKTAVSPPFAGFRFAGIGPAGGFRLARVQPGSLPAALGLRSGDELLSINDYRLTNPEQALTAYARLRYASRLNLLIERNGARTELVYFVR